jgi:hypothetical protein
MPSPTCCDDESVAICGYFCPGTGLGWSDSGHLYLFGRKCLAPNACEFLGAGPVLYRLPAMRAPLSYQTATSCRQLDRFWAGWESVRMSASGCLMRNRALCRDLSRTGGWHSSQADDRDRPPLCVRRQLDLARHRAPVVLDDQIVLVKRRPAIRQLATIALPIGVDTSSSAKRRSRSDSTHGSAYRSPPRLLASSYCIKTSRSAMGARVYESRPSNRLDERIHRHRARSTTTCTTTYEGALNCAQSGRWSLIAQIT